MATWMAKLAAHYDQMRQRYPDDPLMIVFDIDGTILDMRYMVLNVLKAYDRVHGTRIFHKLDVADITVHENHVDRLLAELGIKPEQQRAIHDWYIEHRWTSEALYEAHRPFRGALEVIRWFQIQPNTHVGLNTGRPEAIRQDTLRSLNQLAEAYRVRFTDELLHMNPKGWEQEVQESKVAGVRRFIEEGYRIFAIVDNEPDNLQAITEVVSEDEILLLHADTISESKQLRLPEHSARGSKYDLTELIPEKALPQNVQFVWHGVNDKVNLRQFLASEIRWCECDIRLDEDSGQLVLHHDEPTEPSLEEVQQDLAITLDDLLRRLDAAGRSVKLDLKQGGKLVDTVLARIAAHGFDDSQLWFNGNIDVLCEAGVRKLAEAHPGAIVQCPIGFLAPMISCAPDKTKDILDTLTSWGINRFSISWRMTDLSDFFDQMDRWGYEVNIYDVYDLESFLRAVLLMPHSVTSDFNFPEWYYYGRGSGAGGSHYEYSIRTHHRK